MRVLPPCPPEPRSLGSSAGREVSYHIQTITPVFGGGAQTAFNDDALPVRWPAIRGALRFWWRATRGVRWPTPEDLYEAEAGIWGDTSQPSRVSVGGRVLRRGRPVLRLEPGWPSYVLFPFKPSSFRGRLGLEFELRLSYPPHLHDEVETAVWAWVNFGGLGSRTRRGCGALFCRELAPPAGNPKAWLLSELARRAPEAGRAKSPLDARRPWPTASRWLLCAGRTRPLEAWSQAIEPLRDFRQGSRGRNPGRQPGRPGRSRWPEADTLRRLSGAAHPRHATPVVEVKGFPRADLGLPITFHFKDKGDPFDCTLYPVVDGAEKDRFASPLILKPLAVGPDAAVPCAFRLNVASLAAGIVKGPGGWSVPLADEQWLRPRDFPLHPGSPLAGGTPSALESFWKLLQDRRWS